MKKILYIIFALILCGCTYNVGEESSEIIGANQEQIVNGAPAQHSQFPSVAAIIKYGGTIPSCTGTFIDFNVVLTAAHCVADVTINNLYIVYGENVVSGNDDIDRIPILAKAKCPGNVDLALLLVSESPENVQYVRALPVDRFDEVLASGNIVNIAGYGEIAPDVKGGALYYGESVISGINNSNGNMLLVTGVVDGSNICYGDSGGPAYVRDDYIRYLAGVTRGTINGTCIEGSTFTMPGSYINWINSTSELMQQVVSDPCTECPTGTDGNPVCNINREEMGCDGCSMGSTGDYGLSFFIALLGMFFLFRISKQFKPG